MKSNSVRLILHVVLPFGIVTAAIAQTFEVPWYTLDSGGEMLATGGDFALSGTIGQPDAGPPGMAMVGGDFELVGGFWTASLGCTCPGDLNADGQKDGSDIQDFVSCLIAAGSCSCADLDGVGGVDDSDVALLVSDLLAGDACP